MRRVARDILLWVVVVLLVPVSFAGDSGPLELRLEQLKQAITAEPQSPEKMFHSSFLAQISKSQITEILTQYHEVGGPVSRVTQTDSTGKFSGEYRFTTEKNMVYSVKLGVAAEPPHPINTVWFGPIQPGLQSVDDAMEKFKALPGQVSVAFTRLGGKKPSVVHQLDADRPLAIGSAFKLYVLGTLIDRVQKGEQSWDGVVKLRDEWRSLPSGVTQTWPVGSPVTLHTLATQMISISDNTATDHLLFHLGRTSVEKMLGAMGHKKPALNQPFLSTREMFVIKETGKEAERIEAYSAGALKQRRKYLKEVVGKVKWEDFGGVSLLEPTGIDKVEWFASANDLVRAMDWIRSHTKEADPARGILSVNPGLSFDKKVWSFVGYKGGSEAGVLNLTWLLQRKDGEWFVLSAGWNDTEKSLDEAQFFGLVQGFIDQVSQGDSKN